MAEKKDEDEDKDAEGGEEGAAGEQDETAAKKRKKRKMMIMIAAAVILLAAGGGGFAYYKGMFSAKAPVEAPGKKGKKGKKGGEHAEGGEAAAGEHGTSVKAVKHNPNEWVPGIVPGHEGEDSVFYNMPEFLVNLDTNSKQTSFIKMKVTLEASSEGDNMDAVDNRLPRIIDKFNTYLRLLRISDVAGSAGLYRLKEELLLQVNKEIYPSKVNDVLFQEIIIQ